MTSDGTHDDGAVLGGGSGDAWPPAPVEQFEAALEQEVGGLVQVASDLGSKLDAWVQAARTYRQYQYVELHQVVCYRRKELVSWLTVSLACDCRAARDHAANTIQVCYSALRAGGRAPVECRSD